MASNRTGILAIVLASCIWGTTGTVATFATNVSAIAIGAATMGIGGFLLALSSAKSLIKSRKVLAANWQWSALGGLAIIVYPLSFYNSMSWAGVAIGNVVSIGSAPLFTALLEKVIDKKKLGRKWQTSATFGVVGVALLSLANTHGNAEPSNQVHNHFFGIMYGLVAGFSYASYSWVGHKLIHKGASSNAAMGCIFGVASLFLLPVLFATGANFLNSWQQFSVAAYMAIFPTIIAYKLFGHGLTVVNASTATVITLLEPVVATLLAVFIVNEVIGVQGWMGIIFIGLSLLVVVLPVAKVKQQLGH